MHLGDKEYIVVRLALELQKDQLKEEIAEKGASVSTTDASKLISQIESKFKDGKLNLTLEETQTLFAYLFMFRALNRQMIDSGDGDRDARDYDKAAMNVINGLEQQFKEAGIKISDFMTIHKDQKSFNEAMDRINSGTGRNAPCPCGSGKKYKHCCSK